MIIAIKIKTVKNNPINFQQTISAEIDVAGVAIINAKIAPVEAPLRLSVIAMGKEPTQHTGKNVPTNDEIKIGRKPFSSKVRFNNMRWDKLQKNTANQKTYCQS